ncbi:MAG: heme ABC transporter ATP-binding protein [Pyrinomonadaceae bacterium]
MENNSLIEARNITFEIHSRKILEDVSLRVDCGEVLAVLGPNGAGKSTLRKILCGDLAPTSGEVLMNGKSLEDWSLTERAKSRAVLPQDSSLNFPFTAMEVVLMGRAPHIQGAETKKDYEIARAALRVVEEIELENRIYPTLSGGERQRVQLARVMAQIWESNGDEPRYLLLDEPTSNLDLAHQHSTLKIARRFARENAAVLLILHDLNLAAQYADRIVLLKAGKIVAQGKPREIFTGKIIRETFDLPVSVIEHPQLKYPLIIPSAE